MAENNSNVNDLGEDLEGDKGNAPPLKVDPKVIETAEKAGAAKLYAQIISDPELGEVLKARAAGKKMKLVPADEKVTVTEEAAPDFENMTEHQKHQYVISQVVKETSKLVDTKLAPVNERLDVFNNFAQTLQQRDAMGQVDALKKKHKDFDTFAPRMAELAGEHPRLTADQLYTLAAQEAGKFVPVASRTTSERPSNVIGKSQQKKEKPVGMAKFGGLGALIREAASQTISSMQPGYETDNEE